MTVPVVAAAAPLPEAASLPPVRQLAAQSWPAPAHHASYTRPAPVHANSATIGGHVVQLGAFISAEGANRAEVILARRNPQLHGHGFQITQATVNGRKYWRVVTSGFNFASAAQTCSSLKRHGGACFAYAADHAPQGQALAMAHPPELAFADRRRR